MTLTFDDVYFGTISYISIYDLLNKLHEYYDVEFLAMTDSNYLSRYDNRLIKVDEVVKIKNIDINNFPLHQSMTILDFLMQNNNWNKHPNIHFINICKCIKNDVVPQSYINEYVVFCNYFNIDISDLYDKTRCDGKFKSLLYVKGTPTQYADVLSRYEYFEMYEKCDELFYNKSKDFISEALSKTFISDGIIEYLFAIGGFLKEIVEIECSSNLIYKFLYVYRGEIEELSYANIYADTFIEIILKSSIIDERKINLLSSPKCSHFKKYVDDIYNTNNEKFYEDEIMKINIGERRAEMIKSYIYFPRKFIHNRVMWYLRNMDDTSLYIKNPTIFPLLSKIKIEEYMQCVNPTSYGTILQNNPGYRDSLLYFSKFITIRKIYSKDF